MRGKWETAAFHVVMKYLETKAWAETILLSKRTVCPFLYSIISIVYYEICSAGNIFMSECCIFSQSIGCLPGQRVSCLSNWKRHLQPKEECLHLYLARQKWQCLPLCTASSVSPSRGQEALSPITKCTQKFTSKLPTVFQEQCVDVLYFSASVPNTPIWVVLGFALFLCACICVNVCWPFMLQDPREELYLCCDFVKHCTH